MTTGETIQWLIVIAILIICIIWLISRLRRRNRCSACDSTTCPLKQKNRTDC